MMIFIILIYILFTLHSCVYSWLGAHKKLFVRIAHLYSQSSSPYIQSDTKDSNSNYGFYRQYILTNSLFSTDKSDNSNIRELANDQILDHSYIDATTFNLQPDRLNYMKFFESLSTKKKKIDLLSLYAHDDVRMLLEGQMIDEAYIQDRWTEKVIHNIATKKTSKTKSSSSISLSDQKAISRKDMSLNEQDSYDVLCSVMNLGKASTSLNMSQYVMNTEHQDMNKPDKAHTEKPVKEKNKKTTDKGNVKASSRDGNNHDNNNNYSKEEPFGEDLRYLEQQFQMLVGDNFKSEISWNTFIHWEEIAALLHDGYCELDDVRKAWKEVVGSFTRSLDLKKFIEINRVLDALVDSDTGIDDDVDFSAVDEQSIEFKDGQFTKNPVENTREEELIVDDGFDMGSDADSDSGGETMAGMISGLEDLDPWDPTLDPKQVFDDAFVAYLNDFFDNNSIKAGSMTGLLTYDSFCNWADMKQLLKEGQMDLSCLKDLWMEALIEYQSKRSTNQKSSGRPSLQDGMDLDTFLRMNIRLDMMLDEIEEALANLSDAEVEGYYRKEFAALAENEELLSYSQLMGWADLRELVNNGVITQEQLDRVWNALPKKPLGRYYKAGKGSKIKQSDGITVEAFLMFNEEIEDLGSSEIVGEI